MREIDAIAEALPGKAAVAGDDDVQAAALWVLLAVGVGLLLVVLGVLATRLRYHRTGPYAAYRAAAVAECADVRETARGRHPARVSLKKAM